MEVIKKFEDIDEMNNMQQLNFFFRTCVECEESVVLSLFIEHCRNSGHFFAKLDEYGEFEDWCIG